MFRNRFSAFVGKNIARITRFRGGHGSALPGLVIEKIDPKFLARTLAKLPRGVAVISGTNGKTTTTKMVVKLLRDAGLRVFTNESGSNFSRGVASAAAQKMRRGRLDFDIAVLELDEAHAVRFVHEIRPDFALLLNVLRDQLDRFGEIDTTAKMLGEIAKNTTRALVVNRDDPRLVALAEHAKIPAKYFGFAQNLAPLFPTDEQLHGEKITKNPAPKTRHRALVELENIDENEVSFRIENAKFETKMAISGAHNFINASAAIAFADAILGAKFSAKNAVASVTKVGAAFGRGENFELGNGQKIVLNLVKNPAGFRLVLQSARDDLPTLFAINDAYADGRDVSWLYDVNFAKFAQNSRLFSTGKRAFDMTLRLIFDGAKNVKTESEIARALGDFLAQKSEKLQIFATYTAMLELRKILKSRSENARENREKEPRK